MLEPKRWAVGLLSLAAASTLTCGVGDKERRGVIASPTPGELPVEASDTPARTRRSAALSPGVLWIGLDGLDWELLDHLAAAGKMPNFRRLAAEGHAATLTAFSPLISPVLWTTAATGTSPDLHGVLDFQELEPKTGQRVPISGNSRQVPAIWNLASAAGRKVGVVGWWATHPAEEVHGFFVSDRVTPLLFPQASTAGSVFPASLAGGIDRVRARQQRVSDEELAQYVRLNPGEIAAARAAGVRKTPVVALAETIGATRVAQRIARDLYDRHLPDVFLLYLAGTDEIGHHFASYTPPRLPCTAEADVERYGEVVAKYYGLIDRLLGQWMRRAEEDGATLLLHSDHGFHWGAGRPCGLPSEGWNTAAFWHRPEGVFVAWGARVRPGRSSKGVTLFDIAPTVAALLGIPTDRRMPGNVLRSAFPGVPAPTRQDVFSRVGVRRVAAQPVTEAETAEYARKLMALGYISGADTGAVTATGGDRPGRTEGAWNNLGLYLRETPHDLDRAAATFRKALEVRPDYATAMFNLAALDRMAGDHASGQRWLLRALESGFPDPEGTLLGWAVEDLQKGRVAASEKLLATGVARYPASEKLAQQLAFVRFQRKNCRGAREALAVFETRSREPDTLNSLALYETCLGDRQRAIRLLERSLAAHPDQPGVIDSLGRLRAVPGSSKQE